MKNSILSIQSHVVYGYVGNKASAYPLQSMGFDVLPINTVQFSNHTGYEKFSGQIFSSDHIKDLANGIFNIQKQDEIIAILSGYMGNASICEAVYEIVQKFKKNNKNVIYLCDPVIGDHKTKCYVKPEVSEFFKNNLSADIITPNHFEAEILAEIKIISRDDLKKVAQYFHKKRKIKIVIITGVKLQEKQDKNLESDLYAFASDGENSFLFPVESHYIQKSISGTGDLFSAIFLGSYIKFQKDLYKSLEFTIDCINQVLENTINLDSEELLVTSIDYKIQYKKE
jgi:pyridoxine kinase